MTTAKFSRPPEHTADKKEYKVPLITAEELLSELQQMRKDEAKPLVNIEEKADAFVIEVAAPGLKNSDFNVSINDGLLTITCLHKGDYTKRVYRQQEFDYHAFKKDILLPENIDSYFISAEYDCGIFRVVAPKSIEPFIHRSDWIVVY